MSFTQRPNSLDRTTPAASSALQIRPAPLVISAIMAGSSHYLFVPHCGGDASALLQSCCLGPWAPSGQGLEHSCGDELFFASLRSRRVADYARATPSIQPCSTTGRGVRARGNVLSHWCLGDITRLGFRLVRLRPPQHKFLYVRDGAVRWRISSMGTLCHVARVDCGLGWRISNVASLATSRDYERRTLIVICSAT